MNRHTVIESFNRIAQYTTEGWNHNNHYHPYLLQHLPERREKALDIGSGLGDFSRILGNHFSRVEGIDFSPKMVELARTRSTSNKNVIYYCEDFLEKDYPDNSFDCVASIAAFHHMPLGTVLEKAVRILKPGGCLLVVDL
jgi:ubiquinone/menaquinone biosynthesis C-methylase UbiE